MEVLYNVYMGAMGSNTKVIGFLCESFCNSYAKVLDSHTKAARFSHKINWVPTRRPLGSCANPMCDSRANAIVVL